MLKLSILLVAIFVASQFLFNANFAGADPLQLEPQPVQNNSSATPGAWVENKEVAFVGRLASRSSSMLEWVLKNYQWSQLKEGKENPFNSIWITIRNISYALLGLFVLAAAFLIIITRGKSITARVFIPRFVLVVILVTLSFAILQFLYQITDISQGFFLKKGDGSFINDQDLLHVGFDYGADFGHRRFGIEFDESAFMSILMIKLTALSYYAMFIILIIRKIILWFFLVVSPIFPLLLLFAPIRNTAKIWIGEFFRWLLYAPLFAVFLAGLVTIWQLYIPLNLPCKGEVDSATLYQTSIDIILAGPCQDPSIENSLGTSNTFILYVVALLMLWLVIILPFILLKIFLDYLQNFNLTESNIIKYLAQTSSRLGYKPSSTPPSSPSADTGLAKSLPGMEHSAISEIEKNMQRSQEYINRSISHQAAQQVTGEITNLANLSIPTIRDITRYETALIGGEAQARGEVSRVYETLNRIAGTSTLTSPVEREKFAAVREQLIQQSQAGNAAAASILKAAKPAGEEDLPETNKLQAVNLDDYEEVKRTWVENYRRLEPPLDPSGKPLDRKTWLTEEVKKIPQVIELLTSGDPQKIKQGKEMVSKILPFLLLGGFSKAEIVTYLKAKLEAAKAVLAEVFQVEKDEETKVEVTSEPVEKPKTMQIEVDPNKNR